MMSSSVSRFAFIDGAFSILGDAREGALAGVHSRTSFLTLSAKSLVLVLAVACRPLAG